MNIKLTQEFKKITTKAIISIILFVLVYIIILAIAIGITILCVLGAIQIVIFKPTVITIGLGIGLASLGFFILIFLFKFLFKKHIYDDSHLIEITKKEEPKLFAFIEEIVIEVGTNFPKKIFLSTDVNASVFYDSSFWSMFFPIKKNLQIGLGLVNSITNTEFKAILAHEFGHFSQRTMKVGSYVYNVNKVIYNMLFDNDSFEKMVQTWANLSGYFSIFITIAVKIIQSIQWILRKMYDFINIKYLALSREMEFHADEIAANVAGYLPLKESLLRMELAENSFNNTLNFYENKITENIKSKNLYKEQAFVMNFLANESNIPSKNNLPLVSVYELNKYNKSKLTIKDQWASHPSTEERIEKLEKLNIIKSDETTTPAKELFNSIELTEEKLTNHMFKNIVFKHTPNPLDLNSFEIEYKAYYNTNSLPKEYSGYYDNKNPNIFDLNEDLTNSNFKKVELPFNKTIIDSVYNKVALDNDKYILQGIERKEFDIKTFDYDGQKYKAKEAKNIIAKIENQLIETNESIKKYDYEIYKTFNFYSKKNGNENTLKNKYKKLFEKEVELEKQIILFDNLVKGLAFLNVETPFEKIVSNFEDLEDLEDGLKKNIRILLDNKDIEKEINKEMRINLENYISKNWVYFDKQRFSSINLELLNNALANFNYLIRREYFLIKLDLLKFQLTLI